MDNTHRIRMADEVERHRQMIESSTERHPVELEFSNERDYIRVVIDTRDQLNTLLSQLRADAVSPREALDPTLVWPQ